MFKPKTERKFLSAVSFNNYNFKYLRLNLKKGVYMKKFISAVLLFQILIAINTTQLHSESNWYQQNSGVNNTLWSVDFVNNLTGYVAGSGGLILKTTNGGESWTSHYENGFHNFIGIDFINPLTGWATGHFGAIYKTTNGSQSWVQQTSPTVANLFFVQFINENTGYISSDAGVLKTTNSGLLWSYSFESNHPVYSTYHLNENTGFLGNNLGEQYKTYNGGVNWSLAQTIPGNGSVAYYFVNSQSGWSVGYNNQIIKTTNGGTSWQRQYNNLSDFTLLRDIEFINSSAQIGYVVGFYNTILRTGNGGENWSMQESPVFSDYNAIEFVSDNVGWIVGSGGVILKTNSATLTTLNSNIQSVPDKFELSQNYPNPFNPSTEIKYTLPKNSDVSIKVYDILGNEVKSLINNEFRNAGTFSIKWDGKNNSGLNVSSGAYFYKMITADFNKTLKMLLMK